MKSTQLAYPTAQELAAQGCTPSQPGALASLQLIDDTRAETRQLHYMRDGAVVLYKRTYSSAWQVRFRLFDRRWHRFTTKHRELDYARRVAGEMYDRARFKEEMGLPLRTKRFGAVAELCYQQLQREIEQGLRPMTNRDYQRVIRIGELETR